MNNNINNLVKQYVLWPELQNDYQKNIYFADTSMEDLKKEIESFLHHKTPIDQQIALFYLANQHLSQSRIQTQDVLGVKELEEYQQYQKILGTISKELVTYIIICCIVEARHLIIGDIFDPWKTFCIKYNDNGIFPIEYKMQPQYIDIFTKINSHPYGNEFLHEYFHSYHKYFKTENDFQDFIQFIQIVKINVEDTFSSPDPQSHDRNMEENRNYGYTEIASIFLEQNLHNYSIKKTLTYLNLLFTENEFDYNFGGQPWAKIANHALVFAEGKINAEMFIDHAFSLEHNNGNMFNKDFLFQRTKKTHLSFCLHDSLNNNELCHKETFDLSKIILNAQHLGKLSSLFYFVELFKAFDSLDLNLLYYQFNQDRINNNLSPNLDNYSSSIFHQHIIHIKNSYSSLANSIQPILNYLQTEYPHLLNQLPNTPFNISTIYSEIVDRAQKIDINTISYPHLLDAIQENTGFFDLWHYLSNSKVNQQLTVSTSHKFDFKLYDIDKLSPEIFDKNIIGGKAWSLAHMFQLDMPVPKAKVFTTACSLSYYQHPEQFKETLIQTLPIFENYLKNEVGNPILCSIRSGAVISMPGMMDSILNIGIDDYNYDYFCKKMGKNVIEKCINKFMEGFCASRFNQQIIFNQTLSSNLLTFKDILIKNNIEFNLSTLFPLNKTAQIKESIIAVFESWNSPRAIAYRNEKGISHDLGTAAIVQQMVFGNLNDNSCTGVVFSRDCLTGENKLVGEFLPKAQGDDVVSGSVTPFPIEQFKQFDLKAYNELLIISKNLEKQTGQIQDIEFTVEDGQLYILQHRQAVCSPIANIKLLEDKSLDFNSLIKNIEPKFLQSTLSVSTKESPFITGLSANTGILSGIIITCEEDMNTFKNLYQEKINNNIHFGWIFYANLTSPEHMPLMNKTHAFITEQGGFTSHAAIIARSLNKPCIVGLGGNKAERFKSGDILTIDATQGKIWNKEQILIENNKLAKAAAKILRKSYNINLNDIDHVLFKEHMIAINEKNKSWAFNFPNTYYIKSKPIKKDKFLNIGQKIAILLAADIYSHNQIEKNRIYTIK